MSKFLVVVDVQNDFVTGSLGNAEAQAAIPGIVKEILEGDYDHIVVTRDTHTENYLSGTLEGKLLPVEHTQMNSWGWHIVNAVQKALDLKTEKVEYLNKRTFGSTELPFTIYDWANAGNRFDLTLENSEITLIGFCTDICVVSNALLLRAYFPNTPMRILADKCAGVTPDSHEAALKTMQSCQIEIVR